MSQFSNISTIPYEISQDQDISFLNDLSNVNELYFETSHPATQDLFDVLADDESDLESNHDESDIDIDVEAVIEKSSDNVFIEKSELDLAEADKQNQFKVDTCGCDRKCSSRLNWQDIIEFRSYCQELSKDELDLVIKTELFAQRGTSITVKRGKQSSERVRPSQKYVFKGEQVCQAIFCFVHDVGKQKLQAIGRSLDQDGLKARVHGNKHKLPHNSLTFTDRQNVVQFLHMYASENAVTLPGRLPYVKKAQVLLLPSDKRQADIHAIYEQSAELSVMRSISLSTFSRLWKELCPNIVLARPQTDLCHVCQTFVSKLSAGGNIDEGAKKCLLQEYELHLEFAKRERDFYRENCMKSKDIFKSTSSRQG
jgi:hypothetical protein